MLQDIITNKYFVIALIVILAIVIYMYTQKKCGSNMEGMKKMDRPWLDGEDVDFDNHTKIKKNRIYQILDEEDIEDWISERYRKKNIPHPLDEFDKYYSYPCYSEGNIKKRKPKILIVK